MNIEITKGQTEIILGTGEDQEVWGSVACPLHMGLMAVSEEANGEIDEAGNPVMVPVMSEKVGFQPTCQACEDTLDNTLDHIDMVRINRAAADRENHRLLRRLGAST
jgi:hypothetical protein